MRKVKVGLVGCGMISPAYLNNFTTHFQSILEVTACADLFPALAQKRAADFHIPRACSTAELLADPEIDMVLAITVLPYVIFRTVTGKGSSGKNWFGDLGEIRSKFPDKPLVQCAVGHHEFVVRMRRIAGSSVPLFIAPEPAVRSLAAMYEYSKRIKEK